MKVTSQVQNVLDSENISLEELTAMVKSSAVYSGDGGNRRFHDWLFTTHPDGHLVKMRRLTVTIKSVVSKSHGLFYEQHEDCDGLGCPACGYIGEVGVRYVPAAKKFTPKKFDKP